MIIDPDNLQKKVLMGSTVINNSQVAVTGPDAYGQYTMTFKFTKDLGPGVDFSYWSPGASNNLLTGIKLEPEKILGFQFTYAPVSTLGGSMAEWTGSWSSMTEVHDYYLSKLVP